MAWNKKVSFFLCDSSFSICGTGWQNSHLVGKKPGPVSGKGQQTRPVDKRPLPRMTAGISAASPRGDGCRRAGARCNQGCWHSACPLHVSSRSLGSGHVAPNPSGIRRMSSERGHGNGCEPAAGGRVPAEDCSSLKKSV